MALLDLVRCLLLFHAESTCVSMTSTVCLREEHVTRVCNDRHKCRVWADECGWIKDGISSR